MDRNLNIVMLSPVLNIHQVGIADELFKLTNGKYCFIQTDVMNKSNKKGANDDFSDRPYLIVLNDKWGDDIIYQIIQDADVVMFDGAPMRYLKKRMRTGKLTFNLAEHWLKKGLLNLLSPRLLKQQWFYHIHCHEKPFYALCSSAYAAVDFRLMHAFVGKCYKWGYFTTVSNIDMEAVLREKRNDTVVKILWAGRLIDWKHPETMISLASQLLQEHVNFCIDIIGTGDMLNQLQQQIRDFGLEKHVNLLGAMPNESVKQVMLSHHIACFTSDKNEGWGAVLNEAMSCGCCPVSSIETGSTPYLIKDGVNGFSFNLRKKNNLFEKVLWLIKHPVECEKMSLEAYNTVYNVWSPANAAIQFYKLCDALLNGETLEITEGPCSMA